MDFYHVNEKGEPGVCGATQGRCPYGGASGFEHHYGTEEAAKLWAKTKLEREFGGTFGSTSRTSKRPESGAQAARPDATWTDAVLATPQLGSAAADAYGEGGPPHESYSLRRPFAASSTPLDEDTVVTLDKAYAHFEVTRNFERWRRGESRGVNSNPLGVEIAPEEQEAFEMMTGEGFIPVGGGLYARVDREYASGRQERGDDYGGARTIIFATPTASRSGRFEETIQGIDPATGEVAPVKLVGTSGPLESERFQEGVLSVTYRPSEGGRGASVSYSTPEGLGVRMPLQEWQARESTVSIARLGEAQAERHAIARARAVALSHLYEHDRDSYNYQMAKKWQEANPLKAKLLTFVARRAGRQALAAAEAQEKRELQGLTEASALRFRADAATPGFDYQVRSEELASASRARLARKRADQAALVNTIGYPGVTWNVRTAVSLSTAIAYLPARLREEPQGESTPPAPQFRRGE